MPREGGDTAKPTAATPQQVAAVATTSNAVPTESRHQRQHHHQQQQAGDEDSLDAMAPDQRRAIVEQLAQRLLDDALDDAFEVYLRRDLQQTAEETVREALAAAGAGRPGNGRGAPELNGRGGGGRDSGGLAAAADDDGDEMSVVSGDGGNGNEADDDEDDAEHTLTYGNGPGGLASDGGGSGPGDQRDYSTSPSRLDAGDIFHDLSEMSNFADRIDSILDQTVSENSTRSGRMRSLSPMPQFALEQRPEEEAAAQGDDDVD